MFNKKSKEEIKPKNSEINKLKKRIIPFNDLYQTQLKDFKTKFKLKPIKHMITIITFKEDTHKFEFTDLKEAQSYYEDLLKKWKSDIYIKLDNITIGSTGIVSIDFKEGEHPEEYTEKEIDEWAKIELEEEMKKWKVIKPTIALTMFGDVWEYNIERHENRIY
jgi:hypothetical protein